MSPCPLRHIFVSVMGYRALICAKNISQAHGPESSCCHGSLKNRNKMALIGVYFQPTLSSHESRPEVWRMKAIRHIGTQYPRLLLYPDLMTVWLVSLPTASGADFFQKYTFSSPAWTDYLSTLLSVLSHENKNWCLMLLFTMWVRKSSQRHWPHCIFLLKHFIYGAHDSVNICKPYFG